MRKKVVFFDVDGVLLNWQASFAKWLAYNRYRRLVERLPDRRVLDHLRLGEFITAHTYGMHETGIWKDGSSEFIDDLNEHAESADFHSMPPMVDGQTLAMLKNEGLSLHILTAGGGGSEVSRIGRRMNLALYFPGLFDGVHFLPHKGDKTLFMRAWEQDTGDNVIGIVEDKDSHLVDAAKAGYEAWGIRDFHNKAAQEEAFNIRWFSLTKGACLNIAEFVNA